MMLDLALSFMIGVLSTLFLIVVFGRRNINGDGADVYQRARSRRLAIGPVIVAIGGGTGLSTLLRGIKSFTRNITAVVTVTDEGGSSGRLRTEWGVLPPGDVRNCMVALAENDNALKRILDFRFDRGDLKGHSLGNLLLLAVSELCGDFRVAVEQMNHLLAIRGRVLPVTTESVTLFGETRTGKIVKGEIEVSEHGRELTEIWLEPHDASPLPDVMDAIDDAEIILLGPGSLFTSVIPNLLLADFATKLRDAPAPKIYICNLMTQPEETDGMNVVQHLEWVSAALGTVPDCVIVNSEPIPDNIVEAYREKGATPLYLDYHQRAEIRAMGCTCIEAPIALVTAPSENMSHSGLLRHDPKKLSETIFKIYRYIGQG